MFDNQGGRHYWFAKNLINQVYNPQIFCANTYHNSSKIIEFNDGKYVTKQVENIPFVFVKTTPYTGNGIQRLKNMITFYINLFPVAKEYSKAYGKPDAILASSVHPLTLVAGIKIAKKFGVPCICEVRDLWPESLVAYSRLKKSSLIAKLLYQGEKWIYKKADRLIFTMEGGKDYIIDKSWDIEHGGPVNINKVSHINNGVDLEEYEYNKEHYVTVDEDLDNEQMFKVVYAGAIRKANNVKTIIDAALVINKSDFSNIRFLIYGDGNDKEYLEKYCVEKKISNVVFKGFVEKKYIPYILSKSNLNIIHFEQNGIKKYGVSLNKMFEYFASGKPTISDCEFGYDLCKKYKCGVVVDNADDKQLAEAIIKFSNMPNEKYGEYCKNAIIAAQDYDIRVLAEKLIMVIGL